MLKRLRAAHPICYCILTAVLFLAAMEVGMTLFELVLVLLGPAAVRPFVQETFLLQAVNELFGLLAGLFLLGRTGRLWVCRQRGRGFLDGPFGASWPRRCWSASAPGQPASGKPACSRALCSARYT